MVLGGGLRIAMVLPRTSHSSSMRMRSGDLSGQSIRRIYMLETQWPRGSASRFHATGPGLITRAGQDRLCLSSLQWIDK
ncbi:hypothetical protein TNCV_5013141 [Trichonephila clavipes]|nr:hypothetical protein TNCV_5013141 [Trichonephila clavipes]